MSRWFTWNSPFLPALAIALGVVAVSVMAAPAPKGLPPPKAPPAPPVRVPPTIAAPVPAGPPPTEAAIDEAVAKGIAYLVKQQDATGAMFEDSGRPGGGKVYREGLTALGVMALAAVGNQPTDNTPEGKAMAKALDFVLREENQDINGVLAIKGGANMYVHGITTLMLAEMLGMGVDGKQDALIRERLNKAITLILRSQQVKKQDPKFDGGWRYQPTSTDSDMSVTVWQTMALRAAHNAGVDVPKEAIDRAIAYIKRSYSEPHEAWAKAANKHGGFSYTPPGAGGGGGGTPSCTAEGLLALQVCGDYEAPEVIGSAESLLVDIPTAKLPHYYYTYYYYAQGMYQRGGKYADEAARQTARELIPQQSASGAWNVIGTDGNSGGPIYCTAMAILSLSVKYHYLPIYQR
jgi:hypothetical protein